MWHYTASRIDWSAVWRQYISATAFSLSLSLSHSCFHLFVLLFGPSPSMPSLLNSFNTFFLRQFPSTRCETLNHLTHFLGSMTEEDSVDCFLALPNFIS
ncbi:hypothetical protein BDV59DRAFT_164544 [Aspergillus ambiguus]|uniref:uncharacterized protein n=1 Tax=Aspergillus ambiguus TaxID=176160 RepID=UPI003CCD420C